MDWKAETLELGRTIRRLLHNLRIVSIKAHRREVVQGTKKTWRKESERVEEDIGRKNVFIDTMKFVENDYKLFHSYFLYSAILPHFLRSMFTLFS